MVVESWITPEETPALAAEATAMIDARFGRFGERERTAFWASIRKAYNTPYNPPAPTRIATPTAVASIAVALPDDGLPIAAIAAASVAPEMQAA